MKKEFVVATKHYLSLGKDGWVALLDNKDSIKILRDETICPIVHEIVS